MTLVCMPAPSPQEEKELKETLQDIIGHGKKVKLEQRLIPVFLVEFDQKMFDMSIKTRAREMERVAVEKLSENGEDASDSSLPALNLSSQTLSRPSPIFQSSNLSFPLKHRLGDGFQKRQPLQIRDPKFMMVVQRFTTRATHVNDPGSIDSPLMQSMENKIKEHLNAESVSVKDAYGDGRHVSHRLEVASRLDFLKLKLRLVGGDILIDVISSAFEGQSAVNRQRMVYKAIWEELQSTVHAVDQMSTRTPTEAAAEK
ncbi:Protein BOLA4, chloroplastic/mitochondrial [Vitis vinifera]|uniref:Protein BOLA4, chloroplastic/mitochondrial n=1 Tax=Vitis vinifera TaxID=29760 RepID=A0A438GCL9_VITVI|nr:Protein BOLA4, chloroplastic/mitochondrial [Vitis vinifera]